MRCSITIFNLSVIATALLLVAIGLAIFEVQWPSQECNNQELKTFWNTVFKTQFSSQGTILKEKENSCEDFIMFEVSNANIVKFLGVSSSTNSKSLYAGAYNLIDSK